MKKLFQFLHQTTQALADIPCAETAFRLFLQCAQAASDCKQEPVAYEFMERAFEIFEESIPGAHALVPLVGLPLVGSVSITTTPLVLTPLSKSQIPKPKSLPCSSSWERCIAARYSALRTVPHWFTKQLAIQPSCSRSLTSAVRCTCAHTCSGTTLPKNCAMPRACCSA